MLLVFPYLSLFTWLTHYITTITLDLLVLNLCYFYWELLSYKFFVLTFTVRMRGFVG